MLQLTQDNLANLPSIEGPGVNYSVLRQLDVAMPVHGFSIKLGVKGVETYHVNGLARRVNAGEYLLVNRFCDARVLIDSATPVEGFCLELTSALVDQAVASYIDPGGDLPGLQRTFLTGEDFFEQVRNVRETHVGRALERTAPGSVADALVQGSWPVQYYYDLANALVLDHMPIITRLYHLKAVRNGTRRELFRRIEHVKDRIQSEFHAPLSCASLAAEACMSEYHFHRVFKACTGRSPHNYLLEIRLGNARQMLLNGGHEVSDIALACGFSDIHGFSKAFKKRIGVPPSLFKLTKGRI